MRNELPQNDFAIPFDRYDYRSINGDRIRMGRQTALNKVGIKYIWSYQAGYQKCPTMNCCPIIVLDRENRVSLIRSNLLFGLKPTAIWSLSTVDGLQLWVKLGVKNVLWSSIFFILVFHDLFYLYENVSKKFLYYTYGTPWPGSTQ